MANKSNPATQSISVPHGGGSLHGIGETFSPDPHTGTGNFTVPIATPPGRNGFHPQLSLSYSTGSGNGPYGLGWSLAIPAVTRKTSKGVPRYQADGASPESDTFMLSDDLIPVGTTGAITSYRPRTEGLFSRIERHATPETDHWEVRSKDGLVSVYGTPFTRRSRPGRDCQSREPNRCLRLETVEDGRPVRQHHSIRIRRRCRRCGRPLGSALPEADSLRGLHATRRRRAGPCSSFLVSVTLVYEERPDAFSDHRAGFEIRTRKRCARIEIRTHADQERLVRVYRLVYLDRRDLAIELLPLEWDVAAQSGAGRGA